MVLSPNLDIQDRIRIASGHPSGAESRAVRRSSWTSSRSGRMCAQSHAAASYGRHGFMVCGDEREVGHGRNSGPTRSKTHKPRRTMLN